MTAAIALAVTARTADGTEVASFPLGHGRDPVRELARLGWSVERFDALRPEGEGLVLAFAVRADRGGRGGRGDGGGRDEGGIRGDAGGGRGRGGGGDGGDGRRRGASPDAAAEPWSGKAADVPTEPGLVLAEGETPEPYQRTAAYGVVTSERGVLLTELSGLTSAPGRWTLPGGGLDAGETPEQALHREVWEESGQVISEVRLLDLHTSHWIGRAPSGRLEDFHAVRIVYAARCSEPSDPVVHDVGGSTESVRTVMTHNLGGYQLTRSFAPHLRRWIGA